MFKMLRECLSHSAGEINNDLIYVARDRKELLDHIGVLV